MLPDLIAQWCASFNARVWAAFSLFTWVELAILVAPLLISWWWAMADYQRLEAEVVGLREELARKTPARWRANE